MPSVFYFLRFFSQRLLALHIFFWYIFLITQTLQEKSGQVHINSPVPLHLAFSHIFVFSHIYLYKITLEEAAILSNTKIIVLQRKELIYTGIFAFLILFFVLLIFLMFGGKKNTTKQADSQYTPGVYTSELALNDTLLNIEVVVDENHINSVSFSNIDESVTAMYPLLQPALTDLETQLCNNIPINEVVTNDESKYTQTLLLDAIKTALEKAK